jgi:hypothetical protein
VDGILDRVPADPAARLEWLRTTRSERISDAVRAALKKRYAAKADSVTNAEAFELCEYGRQPNEEELRRLFPE